MLRSSEFMNLAKVSQKTGISPRMLRHYEAVGLIAPLRKNNNYREYTTLDLDKIMKIKTLNEAGIPLKKIHDFLPCFNAKEQSFNLCPIVESKINEQKQIILNQIKKLEYCYHLLDDFINKK